MAILHPFLVWLPLLAFALSCGGTYWLAYDMKKRGAFDPALPRSSHARAVPRGGGLALMSAFVLAAALLGFNVGFLCLAGVLVFVSWIDDRTGLDWQLRLVAQCFAVGFSLALMLLSGTLAELHALLPFLPFTIFVLASALMFLWYINQFNFTDGIDGLAVSQACVTSFGCATFLLLLTTDMATGFTALALGGAALGFFVWNFPPARIFLGDVGSIPLGFLTGLLLLITAASGGWGLALALPCWLWLDASVTLLRRVLSGHSPMQAHRSHLYQLAAGREIAGHRRVMKVFIGLQALHCLALAISLYLWPDWQVVLPFISLGFGLIYFAALFALSAQHKN